MLGGFNYRGRGVREDRVAIDLFAGCGGISLGAELAGFDVRLAVEKSPMAAETHFRNFHLRDRSRWHETDASGNLTPEQVEWEQHLALSVPGPGMDLRAQAKAGLVVGDVRAIVREQEILVDLAEPRPALLAGGPPCQGFSMAGRRRHDDERNELPWAFLDLVDELNPKAVLVENVVGISRAFQANGGDEEPPFEQLAMALEDRARGYVVQRLEVNARHYGVAQSRPRMMLVALAEDVARALDIVPSRDVWRSGTAFSSHEEPAYEHQLSLVPPIGGLYPGARRWDEVAAGEVLSDLLSVEPDHDVRHAPDHAYYEDRPLARWLRTWSPADVTDIRPLMNQRPRRHSSRVVQRFALLQRLRDLGLDAGRVMRAAHGSADGARARVLRVMGDADVSLRDEGRPFSEPGDRDLADVVVRLATRKHSQRAIELVAPSPTVLTLPDDYVHPVLPRVMTVRELARLQAFPDWFEFRAKETTGGARRRTQVPQYSQVGNAVPPVMAWTILDHVRWLLDRHDEIAS